MQYWRQAKRSAIKMGKKSKNKRKTDRKAQAKELARARESAIARDAQAATDESAECNEARAARVDLVEAAYQPTSKVVRFLSVVAYKETIQAQKDWLEISEAYSERETHYLTFIIRILISNLCSAHKRDKHPLLPNWTFLAWSLEDLYDTFDNDVPKSELQKTLLQEALGCVYNENYHRATIAICLFEMTLDTFINYGPFGDADSGGRQLLLTRIDHVRYLSLFFKAPFLRQIKKGLKKIVPIFFCHTCSRLCPLDKLDICQRCQESCYCSKICAQNHRSNKCVEAYHIDEVVRRLGLGCTVEFQNRTTSQAKELLVAKDNLKAANMHCWIKLRYFLTLFDRLPYAYFLKKPLQPLQIDMTQCNLNGARESKEADEGKKKAKLKKLATCAALAAAEWEYEADLVADVISNDFEGLD